MITKTKVVEHNERLYGLAADGTPYKIMIEKGDSAYTAVLSEVNSGDNVLIRPVGREWVSIKEAYPRKREWAGLPLDDAGEIVDETEPAEDILVKENLAKLVTIDFDADCIGCLFGNNPIPAVPSSKYMQRVYRDAGLLKPSWQMPNDNFCKRGESVFNSFDGGWRQRLLERIEEFEGAHLDSYRRARIVKERGEYVLEQDGQLFPISGTNDPKYLWDGEKIKMPARILGSRWIWFKKGQPVVTEIPRKKKEATRAIVANFDSGREMRFRQMLFGMEEDSGRRLTRYDEVLAGQLENSWRMCKEK